MLTNQNDSDIINLPNKNFKIFDGVVVRHYPIFFCLTTFEICGIIIFVESLVRQG